MSKDSKGKPIHWLKGVIYANSAEENARDKETFASEPPLQDAKTDNEPDDNSVFSKDKQDKVSLDLILAAENMLKDRRLLLYKLAGLEEQLQAEKELTARLKHELMKESQLVKEKEKEINLLENKLTTKQMDYDQLLEDYKSYQLTSTQEYEQLTAQLEAEMNKYTRLKEEATEKQYQQMLQIKELEERIRELEVENQQYLQQYQKIQNEKTKLMQTFNEFTERMSVNFTAEPTSSSTKSDE